MKFNCPFCGSLVDKNAKTCSNCGKSFGGIEYFFKGMTDIFSFTDGCVFNQYMEANYSYSDIPSLWLGILSCGLLKFVDESLKFSKKDIVAKYNEYKDDPNIENILLETAKYPNGEELGFYNFSPYTISEIGTFYEGKEEPKNKNEIYFMVVEYLSCFDLKLTEILDDLKIYDVVTFLYQEDLLYELFWNLAHYDLDFKIFNNSKNLSDAYTQFLEEFLALKDNEFKKMYMNEIPKEMDYDTSIYPFLAKILISGTNLSDMESINLYDPNFKDGILIKEVKDLIKKENSNIKINTYANDDISIFKTINFSKTLFDKNFNYEYLKTKSFKYKDSLDDFDLIVTDLNDYKDFQLSQFDLLREFTYKVETKTKLVLKFNSNLLNNLFPAFDCLIYNDYLESLILLPSKKDKSSDVILVINTNKEDNSKDKFLLIDEFNNKTNISKDFELQKKILNSYSGFEEYSNSKLISNSDVFINGINFTPIYWELDDANDYFKMDIHDFSGMEEKYNESIMIHNNFIEYASEKIFNKFAHFIKERGYKEILDDYDRGEKDIEEDLKFKKIHNEFILLNTYKNHANFYAFSFTIDSHKHHFNFHDLVYDIHRGFKFDHPNIHYLGEFCEIFDFKRFIDVMNLNHMEYNITKYINSLFISKSKPQLGKKQAFYSWELDEELEEYDFIELVIMDKDISIEYLYDYLNSDRGIKELYYFSRGENELNPFSMNYLRVPIPSLEEQGNIVQAVAKSNEFFKSIDILKSKYNNDILDYKEILEDIQIFEGKMTPEGNNIDMNQNWKHLYGELLWPLAITYLSVTKGNFEKSEKLDKYLKLFEFVTAFDVILLLSALPEDIYDTLKDEIWGKKYKYYYNMTFGSWYNLLVRLSDIYRDYTFSTEINKDVFLEISNQQAINILEKAYTIRNREAHGAIINSFESEEIVKSLDSKLYGLFDILSSLSGYKLYYITGKTELISENEIEYQVITLNGPCSQPIVNYVVYDEILSRNGLYLYDKYNNKILKLKSNLIKFIDVDKTKDEWALFIFNGTEMDANGNVRARYKCYQQTEDDLFVDIDSFKKDIIS